MLQFQFLVFIFVNFNSHGLTSADSLSWTPTQRNLKNSDEFDFKTRGPASRIRKRIDKPNDIRSKIYRRKKTLHHVIQKQNTGIEGKRFKFQSNSRTAATDVITNPKTGSLITPSLPRRLERKIKKVNNKSLKKEEEEYMAEVFGTKEEDYTEAADAEDWDEVFEEIDYKRIFNTSTTEMEGIEITTQVVPLYRLRTGQHNIMNPNDQFQRNNDRKYNKNGFQIHRHQGENG
ncbi:uncharacterized protein LOC118187828 isoform X2 [Stegodyphus dumicola]|uniref:uncharacterized protein LOC118187828 isoform X2 n=1 Tax=Stegodyphus dumicola TaxID=202533 RepID=UPI0015B346CF|nr:uncharacterized protein LOC118187828 isoform X2 [Stegodyphus dumicola]